jgi:hypothetical protein
VRDRLPVNGAGAVNLPDPQAEEPEVRHLCAYSKCRQELRNGDEVVLSVTGEAFCGAECYLGHAVERGDVSIVVLSKHGDVVVRGMG